jgi:alpha-beta hydrolase superfamily lysophospholipase
VLDGVYWAVEAPASLEERELPVLSFGQALAQVAAIASAEEDPRINPTCRGYAVTHGRPVERATLLIHGYTNCPRQYRAFAARLHGLGHNVYVPRMPHHGLADRMNTDQARLGEAEMLRYLDEALEVAHGLGAEVRVMGISAGAVLAAHAAQHRADVARAVVIAPVFGTPGVADWAVKPLVTAAAILPNAFRWWDPQLRDARRGPAYTYPRFSTRALARIVTIGRNLLREAEARPPAAGSIALVTNAADAAVDNGPTERLGKAWARHGARLRTYTFGAELGYIHDIIDPEQEQQHVEDIYPVLLGLLDE